MSEFEDRVNSILNDPAQMEKITNLAKSLMGNERGPAAADGGMAELAKGLMGGEGGIDGAMLQKISRLMSAGSAQDSEKQALLEAMKPYLSEKRRTKMDRALRIARMARIARLAMGELGEDGHV